MKTSTWLSLITLALLWGGAFILLEVALRDLHPLTIVFLRVALASGALFALALAKGESFPRGGRIWAGYFFLGLLSNVTPFLLIAWAQQTVSPGITSTLCAITPAFTLLVGRMVVPRERLTRHKLGGIVLGLAGVGLMLAMACRAGAGGGCAGLVAVLMAAFSYACGAILGQRFERQSPLVNAAAMLGCSTVILLPVIILSGSLSPAGVAPVAVMAVVGLAVFSTAGGFVLYFHMLRADGPLRSSWISFLVPVSTAILGALVLGEVPRGDSVIAGILVLAGLLVLNRENAAGAVRCRGSRRKAINPSVAEAR